MRSFVDAHCDTIVKLCDDQGELFKNEKHLDVCRLLQFQEPVQFFAVWLHPKYYEKPLEQTIKYLDFYEEQMKKNHDYISHADTFMQILDNKKNGKISAVLTLEGGEALEGQISALEMFYKRGVRGMTLTWNHRNLLADGVSQGINARGLTDFGKEVLCEMEKLGMLVDVSHLAEVGFRDVYRRAKKPFIASHSNARSICSAPRNLTDDQLRAVAATGGVVGLNFYTPFLSQEKIVGIDHILRHTAHMLQVMGEDYIALGSDFDGIDQMPAELENILGLEKLFMAFEKEFGAEVADKIMEKNMLRVLEEVW